MNPAIRAFRLAVVAAILLAWGLAARQAMAGHDEAPAPVALGHTPVEVMPPAMRAAYIAGIQEELAAHGYRPGPADGVLRPATARSIAAYQRDAGLPVDGVATKELLDHLKFVLPKVYAARFPMQAEPAPERPRLAPAPLQPPVEPAPTLPESRPDVYPGTPIPLLPQNAPLHEREDRVYLPDEVTVEELPAAPTVPEPPEAPARPGGRGGVVSEIQEELAYRGYYDGPVDGRYTAETEAAVRRFQKDTGLPVTGQIDTSLLDALLPEPDEVTEL